LNSEYSELHTKNIRI